MSTKKGSRSSFAAGRSNAGPNGKVSSSSPASSASATSATATSTTTTTTTTTTAAATTTNAWVRPLHSKPATRPPPGLGGPPMNEKPKVIDTNSSNLQIALRDRFIHLAVSMAGQKVVLTQTNGAVIEGLFGTFTPFAGQPPQTRNIYVIKACRLIKQPTARDAARLTMKDGETIVIPVEKVSNVLIKSMRLDATGSNGISHATGSTKPADMFQTDTEISAAKSGARSGDLIAAGSAWTSPAAVAAAASTPSSNSRADALLGALEDKGTRPAKPFASAAAGGLRGNIGEWDQFKANEELFNVSASFDENLYTTELDKSRIDAKTMAEAERIAREIEQMTSSNMHVAEERGQAVQTDYDEEDRFSGVLPKDAVAKAGSVPRKEKQNEKAPPLPVSNSRASALKGPITTNDAPKKTVPAPPKKMNYAAAVAAAAASQADAAKKASVSPPTSAASSVVARATPERPTQNDIATVTPDEKPPAQEEQLKESVEVIETAMDAPRDVAAESVVAEPHTESLPEEVIKVVEESVVEEQPPVEQPLEVSIQDHVTPVELHQPMEDESASGSTLAEESDAPKKVSSKLNVNAKEFTFNPTAKPFTPGGAFPANAPVPAAVNAAAPEAHFVDPNTGMPMGHVPPHMHSVHYLPPGHMGQHAGMIPMMNPQFFRFQPPYPGMDQSMASMMQQQPQNMQHIQQAVGEQHSATPSSASESAEDEPMNQQRDTAPQQPSPHIPQQIPQQAQAPPPPMPNQQQMQVAYHVPPPGGVGYFSPGMTMGPRGPGMPHMGGYHPQFVPAQQMQVVPGSGPYRHMYPMQPGMPPNMQMRAPYYPNAGAPMHYPPNAFPGGGRMMDDGDYRGGRGARGPGGRGRRGGRRGGRGGGRAYYPPGSTGSGRQTPQSPPEMGDGIQELPDGTVVMHADMSALGPSDDQRELAD